MNRIVFFAFVAIAFTAASTLTAQEANDTYEYAEIVSDLDGVGTPKIKDNCIVFTETHSYRYVGIAFDFESFRTVHPFKIRSRHDVDGNVTSSYFFYILPLSRDMKSFTYQLVVDGLWTTDPQNPSSVYDPQTGIRTSKITLAQPQKTETQQNRTGTVHFVYKGQSGEQIRLGGNFTNWDSWIYELQETTPGVYELDLALAPGTYYYSFYHGITPLLDDTNSQHAYTSDGRKISMITVRALD